jgi:hypothetical protein
MSALMVVKKSRKVRFTVLALLANFGQLAILSQTREIIPRVLGVILLGLVAYLLAKQVKSRPHTITDEVYFSNLLWIILPVTCLLVGVAIAVPLM